MSNNFIDLYDVSSIFDLEEKASKLSSIGVSSTIDIQQTISSGILCLDLIIGGGLQAGRAYEIVGPEHGGKTTTLYSIMSQALKFLPRQEKGIFEDIEGLIDPKWFGNICGYEDMSDIFGEKEEDTGEWVKKPQIRYYKVVIGEQGLKFLKRFLHMLPNKVLEGNTWYYVWVPRPSKVVKKTGGHTATDLKAMLKDLFSKKLMAKTGNFFVPVPNNYPGPEMVCGIDSWASMTPESTAEDDSDAMAQQARMFAKHLNDIKSLVTAKGVLLVGTNQIRHKPLAFGNPEDTPGGNTLKHMTDCRIRFNTVSNPNGGGLVEEEDFDKYRHFKVRIIKNKLFIPYKECIGRWWIEHEGNSGFGPDPVFDTMEYLKMTHQFVGTRSGFRLQIQSKNNSKRVEALHAKEWKYAEFKQAVLSPASNPFCAKYRFDIRKACISQLRSGAGVRLYLHGTLD